MEKKLYRVMRGKMLAGVCSGLAEYFKLDVSIVRLLWALSTLFAGASIIAYIICAFVIPEKPDNFIY